jgi:hypothetical protein
MQWVKTLSAVLLCGAASFATTVTISAPTSSTTTSPVQVAASVDQPGELLQLWIDGQKITETTSTVLSASVALATGTHRVAVQSVSSSNQITKTVEDITVTSAPPPPAGGVTILRNLQESTGWETCGTCGNQQGKGGQASYTMTRGLTTPAIDNSATSTQYQIGGLVPYTNGYWYIEHPAPTAPVKNLVYDFYLYVPDASATAPQAIEFECQHTVNGYTYNFAWQADYGTHTWRTFDYNNRVWVPTTISFTGFTPGTWHRITAQYHASGAYTVHDALIVDGVRRVVTIVRPAKYTGQTWDSFTNGFQLDLNGKPTGFEVYVDKMNITYQ